jgi:hypothetical protein
MDKASLKEVFAKKVSRRDTTNDAYAQRLSSLTKKYGKFKEEEFKSWEFLKDTQDVIQFISEATTTRKDKEGNPKKPSDATKIGNLTPIIEYLTLIDEHILAEDYSKVKKVLDDKVIGSYQKGKSLTENQSENMISYEDLVDYMVKIEEEIKIIKDKPLKTHLDEWKIIELENLRLLMRLYVLHPSRNEYATLKFINITDYKKLKQPEFNYVVIGTKKVYLSITEYKTSEKYGRKLIDIEDKALIKMLRDLKKTRDIEGRDHLFYLTKTDEPWSNHTVTSIMTKNSKQLIGKSIGSTLLYKIIIQEAGINYNEALENNDLDKAVKYDEILAKYAKTRGHSQAIQKLVYVTDK